MKKIQYSLISTILSVLLLLLPVSVAVATEITLAAANSTCAPLKKAAKIFSQQQGVTIHFICKSSGVLAKGIESGYITADYYISANQKWMDYLVSAGLIEPVDINALWDNIIVAAAAKQSTIELQSWDELATAKVRTVLVGDPSTTPLGRQFKNAMLERGLWLQIRPKIITKRHMSLTRDALVSANGTTIGILFPTSLDSRLKTILSMPTKWHEPIRYYAGPLQASKHKKEIVILNDFLKSDTVNEIFRQKGFLTLPRHE